MTSFATMKCKVAEEKFFGKSDAEFAKHDTEVAKVRAMFDELKALADEGKKDTAEWLAKWSVYKVEFKKVNGYNPLWAR